MKSETWHMAFGVSANVPITSPLDHSIPDSTRQFLQEYGFPRVVIFEGVNPFEIRFHQLREQLSEINDQLDEPEAAWDGHLIIGEFEACSIRWDICLNRHDGSVCTIDVELDEPFGTMNSSLRQAGESILALLNWSNTHPTEDGIDFSGLGPTMNEIDAHSYNSARNFWRFVVNDVQHSSEIQRVTCATNESKVRY